MSTHPVVESPLETPGPESTGLFSPLRLRGVTLPNRIGVSPMCQYSAQDGLAHHWHLVHLGSRAVGGAGLVMVEASAVDPRGRITPGDLGIWSEAHAAALAPVASFIDAQGSVPAIQLAHAGRKASCAVPWEGGRQLSPSEGGWKTVAPSPLGFNPTGDPPHALTTAEIEALTEAFAAAARRSVAAGFRVIEIHAAHGYLLAEFLSPLANRRTDQYGGTFENRTRFLREVVQAVRAAIPSDLPLFVRVSATDWAGDEGWTPTDTVNLASLLLPLGVDLLDCSSGGAVPGVKVPVAPGYQVPFAARVRAEAGLPTAAVGMITDPHQAQSIISEGAADLVLLARELLRDPYWPLHAAATLGVKTRIPDQYLRAF